MERLGARIDLDLLPDEVVEAINNLHLMFKQHTTYDEVQVTLIDLKYGMSLPTIDIGIYDD